MRQSQNAAASGLKEKGSRALGLASRQFLIGASPLANSGHSKEIFSVLDRLYVRAVLRAARATFRPVLRVARATFRPVLRVARATFRPVLRVTRATFRPVLRGVRAVLRAVLRAVRAVLRAVVFLVVVGFPDFFVAIVFLRFRFDSPSARLAVRFHQITLDFLQTCLRTWQVNYFLLEGRG